MITFRRRSITLTKAEATKGKQKHETQLCSHLLCSFDILLIIETHLQYSHNNLQLVELCNPHIYM